MDIELRQQLRRLERQRKAEEAEKQAIKDVIEIACKRASEAVKAGKIPAAQLAPGQQIVALQKYIEDLRAVGQELVDEYGQEAKDELGDIRYYIRKAIAAIADIRLEQINPNRL